MANGSNNRTPLSSIDTVLLRMEHPTHPMIVTGVLIFEAPLDFERLKALLQQRLLRLDRFRQRVRQTGLNGATPYWEEDPDLDLDAHLVRVTLNPPGDQTVLRELVSQLSSSPLDLSRPLWQFHLVEPYGTGCALICRLHHSIGDGIALAHTLLSLTDADPDVPPPNNMIEGGRQDGRYPTQHREQSASPARKATRWMLQHGRQILADPAHARNLVHQGARGARALARMALRWPDPDSPFKGPLSPEKRVAWSEPVPLADIKVIGRGFGATVNDVLLAAITGALRQYIQGQETETDTSSAQSGPNGDFRAVIPVNVRPPGAELTLDNQFGSIFVTLPLRITDPIDRLWEVKRRMDELKGSLEAPATFSLLNLMGLASPSLQDVAVKVLETKATAVVSNVIGPKESIFLAGVPLDSIIFFLPHTARLGLGMSILSYAGQVRLGVITDQGLAPDPERVVAGFHAEFDELLNRTGEAQRTPNLQELMANLDGVLEKLDVLLTDMEKKVDKSTERNKNERDEGSC